VCWRQGGHGPYYAIHDSWTDMRCSNGGLWVGGEVDRRLDWEVGRILDFTPTAWRKEVRGKVESTWAGKQ
jgi:hypothetical protein